MMALAQSDPEGYKLLQERRKTQQAQLSKLSATEANKIRQQQADIKKKERAIKYTEASNAEDEKEEERIFEEQETQIQQAEKEIKKDLAT